MIDDPPPALRRPLSLADGRAFAAVWPLTRTTRLPLASARPNGPGGAPPVEAVGGRVVRQLHVLAGDGVLFGPAGDRPLSDLGLDLALPEPPSPDRLLRRRAVERYRQGHRPEPLDLLARLVACYDAFVDFGRSLADQETMCQLLACCSLSTWLVDAFPVAPYLWFAGARGSGKTQLGTVWARTSYLGDVVLGGGSYAALRDLAEAGAALYFDDAEAFAGRRGAGARRELVLAGNRRGARVALKAYHEGGWRTRWIDTHAPRAFSAIGPPDGTLGSRAIVVPLTRTGDALRGDRDPLDESAWPCDRHQLLDDLWAFALAHLPEAPRLWRAAAGDAAVVGREFEKWRPLLAVARLLDSRGADGLEARLRGTLAAYQSERVDLVASDETAEVILGLVDLASELLLKARAIRWGPALLHRLERSVLEVDNTLLHAHIAMAVPDSQLTARARHAAATRIGLTMRHLRFRSGRARAGDRARCWLVTIEQVRELARAHGLPGPTPEPVDAPSG